MWREEIVGDARLILADCREVLPTLSGVEAVVTDPPYGIGHKHSGRRSSSSKWTKGNDHPIEMDNETFDPTPYLAPITVMFGADHFANRLPSGGMFHVWDKECGRSGRFDSFSDAELFWTSWQCKRLVIRYLWKGLQVEHPLKDSERFHPTQKPVEVMQGIITIVRSQSVLDPFMGSGTTGVACARLRRRFIGVEIDLKYFDIACRRVEQAQRQGDLFNDPTELRTRTHNLGVHDLFKHLEDKS